MIEDIDEIFNAVDGEDDKKEKKKKKKKEREKTFDEGDEDGGSDGWVTTVIPVVMSRNLGLVARSVVRCAVYFQTYVRSVAWWGQFQFWENNMCKTKAC